MLCLLDLQDWSSNFKFISLSGFFVVVVVVVVMGFYYCGYCFACSVFV